MTEQRAFHLDGGNVLATADDHVLVAIADLDIAVGVHHSGIARPEPAAAQGFRRGFGIVPVAFHYDVAAGDDLAQRSPIAWYVPIHRVDDPQLTGRDQLDALPRLCRRELARGELRILRPPLADGDERRGLGETVNVRDLPAELAVDALYCRGGRRRAGRDHAKPAGQTA